MKADFLYSTDFYGMNSKELSHTCMHLLCTAGEGSFEFNEHCYHIAKNDLVVIPYPNRVSNLAAHSNMQVEWFAADYKFLQNPAARPMEGIIAKASQRIRLLADLAR